ncbi:threonine/serine exporter family protein [Persicobacter diffluens]|uniref:Threonine/serine exporter-like N-terminal domain-containing protein n=1 Tax=Persicobacter diffluens TaxID=981 RepID=A0AAN4W015_9BACT|nr:hypothetical protein PEDI_34550 [Persicobacter diffluens]
MIEKKLDLLFRTAEMLLGSGANSNRLERNLRRAAAIFGMDQHHLQFHFTLRTVMICYQEDGRHYYRMHKVLHHGVNMQIISGLSRMIWKGFWEGFTLVDYERELDRLSNLPKQYPRPVVIAGVALACAAFCKLLGGDFYALAFTFLASSLALFIRQELHHRHQNLYFTVLVSATVASGIASLNALLPYSSTPNHAMMAAVLFLIPGVPLINTVDDLIDGFTLMGTSRGMVAFLLLMSIALGFLLVISTLNISN